MTDFRLRLQRAFALRPALRIGFGLSCMVMALLLAADMVFKVMPDPQATLRSQRTYIGEALATNVAHLIEFEHEERLAQVFADLRAREASVRSIAVRRADGGIIAQTGDHGNWWRLAPGEASNLDNTRLVLSMDGERWGEVQIAFTPATPEGLGQWLPVPSLVLAGILGLICFGGFAVYLKRVLSYLDPSTIIPERVRRAYDALPCGVVILDTAGRIMLMNSTLRPWIGKTRDAQLTGKPLESLATLGPALPADRDLHPWVRAMRTGKPTLDEHLELKAGEDSVVRLLVDSTPITDGGGKVRGCLIAFNNVTHIHALNTRLLGTMKELEQSKRAIEEKNAELLKLATRDPLTGCLNRRALFEKLDVLFANARDQGLSLCCIMTDIDHFKSFNDRYGHAVGDEVLKAVSRVFANGLRDQDLLGRYGGEEFCLILPGVSVEQACVIAERLRASIEAEAGASVRSTQNLRVTSSFGVSVFTHDLADPAEMIDHADKALYAAKKSGRNRVTTATPDIVQAA
ncbi:MAG: diguanylate cyclase [Betaproteobacteria bacterium]